MSSKFYTKLGFQYNGQQSSDEIASLLFGENNFIINFFTKERLKDERNGSVGNWETQSEIIFSLSAKDKEEVNQWREKVLEAGGTVFSEPQD